MCVIVHIPHAVQTLDMLMHKPLHRRAVDLYYKAIHRAFHNRPVGYLDMQSKSVDFVTVAEAHSGSDKIQSTPACTSCAAAACSCGLEPLSIAASMAEQADR